MAQKEKSRLEERIARLTQCLLHSAAADSLTAERRQRAGESAEGLLGSAGEMAALQEFRMDHRVMIGGIFVFFLSLRLSLWR